MPQQWSDQRSDGESGLVGYDIVIESKGAVLDPTKLVRLSCGK